MSTVYVGGYWKDITGLTVRQLKEMLDAVDADLRAKGATVVFVDEVDGEDSEIFLRGSRPLTAEEEEEAKRIQAMSEDVAVRKHIEYLERVTGKEVKLV